MVWELRLEDVQTLLFSEPGLQTKLLEGCTLDLQLGVD